ncbi:proteinase inhibitor [Nitrosopumilus sp. b2]|uniref:proteinase inhibitor n=1 Tax=Nitrosopumilus sp. b2 TaxID=2109908 RepID=UPI0015F43FE9|nr:proteinase inhibitor [Nitrosopumilus sp. b2]KAF6244793.1 proteinase inhibitor [Nitrosopumilus sp. b2]
MNKTTLVGIGIAAIAITVFVLALTNPNLRENKDTYFGFIDTKPEPVPPVTQQDLRVMIDEWMENPQDDDREQRLEIMKAYYTFQESGQKLSVDRDGRVMYNQIVKMVSLDIPKAELDQIKQNIRDELKELGFKIQN